MPTTTVQFQNVEAWEGTSGSLSNAIDGDDGTAATISQPADGASASIRLWNPTVPGDLTSLISVTLHAVRQFASSPGRGYPNVARIYSRESDGAAWTVRYDAGVDYLAKQTTDTVIPVTSLADLQILVENYNTPAGGGDPDPPDVGA